MKIGLVDVDSHNFPNLALMKISSYYKDKNFDVEFVDGYKKYDQIYVSKIFTESKEPDYLKDYENIIKGGSGYDLYNKLSDEIEHASPDYTLYPQYDFALGKMTIGCPRVNHKFCITPQKDGCVSRSHSPIGEFWKGQNKIVLLDQNILACVYKIDILKSLENVVGTKAEIEFNGGIDIRFLNGEIIDYFKKLKIKDYHFAWDDPKEDLKSKFELFKNSGLKNTNQVGVYVLTNFWSSIEEDLYRIYTLREMGFMPYVMIFDKQKYVNSRGRWNQGIEDTFTYEQLKHFKTVQHMQRWCNSRNIIKSVSRFEYYDGYKNWVKKGMKVPIKG